MESEDPRPPEEPTPEEPMMDATEPEVLHELRRDYHDRIAALRAMSMAIVGQAAERVQATVSRLRLGEPTAEAGQPDLKAVAVARVSDVEAEVLALLALEAPVARDLRMILSSRDIAHLGELCIGLGQVLSASAGHARDFLPSAMRDQMCRIAGESADLLSRANGAWVALDEGQAHGVIDRVGGTRHLLRAFFADVASLANVPVEAAVELGLTIRACERLSDHAVEMADRVLFAIGGTTPGSVLDALSS